VVHRLVASPAPAEEQAQLKALLQKTAEFLGFPPLSQPVDEQAVSASFDAQAGALLQSGEEVRVEQRPYGGLVRTLQLVILAEIRKGVEVDVLHTDGVPDAMEDALGAQVE